MLRLEERRRSSKRIKISICTISKNHSALLSGKNALFSLTNFPVCPFNLIALFYFPI
jgi:hypothetical protein